MKAYILIKIRTGEVKDVIRSLKKVEGVIEAHMTFGPYDVVATVQTSDINHLGHLVASEIQPIPGILDTLTCMIVDV